MCLAYFEGKGYSDGFTVNMQKMLEFFEKGADIELTVSGDEICKECPNLKEGSCVSAGLVEAYDRKVLEACGLSEKAQMRFQEFVENVQKNVIESGKRVEICGNCQWNEICANKQSRWKRNKLKIINEKHRRQMKVVSVCGVFWNIILKYVQQRLVRSVHQ